MQTFEIVWAIIFILLSLGVGLALLYLVFGAISLILLSPFFVAWGILTIIAMIVGVACVMFGEFCKWMLDSLKQLIGIEVRRKIDSGTYEQVETESDEMFSVGDEKKFDPYKVLNVNRDATHQDIRTAYIREISRYHPDKVSHLGADLQALAEEKSKGIQRAYSELCSA